MTVLELMERAGTKETTLATAWIKDAIHLIQSSTSERTKVVKYNVIDGERDGRAGIKWIGMIAKKFCFQIHDVICSCKCNINLYRIGTNPINIKNKNSNTICLSIN